MLNTGHGRRNLVSRCHGLDQAPPIRVRRGIQNLDRADGDSFDTVLVRDVHRNSAPGPPHGTDDIGQQLRYYQAAESSGEKGFVKKEAGLYCT